MIHSENPFLPEPGDRDEARRFRGRIAAGVTIVTAGSESERIGLSVSSLFVVEGEPALVYALVGPNTDLWQTTGETGRFVVHVCRFEHHQLVDVFAGLAPSPGGLFVKVKTTQSEWGPLLTDLPDRAYCTMVSQEETGWSGLVVGRIDKVEVSNIEDPLVHFRSGYHRLVD